MAERIGRRMLLEHQRVTVETSGPIELERLAGIATRQRLRSGGTYWQVLARTTIVQLIDDIDGSKAAETVRFAVDGGTYEIDLSAEHTEGLWHSLAQFVAAARQAGRVDASSRRGQSRHGRSQGGDSLAVRAWAKENGVPVSPRGRVPQAVVDQYTGTQPAAVAETAPAEPVPAGSADKPKRSRSRRG